MADIILGCDTNRVTEDKKTLNTISSKLKSAGHNVEVLSVGPNYVQSAMQKNRNKGKVAVFLVNGADLQTYKDFYQGITRGYYYVKYAYFGLEGWISPSTCSCEGAKTAKLKKAHDDASSSSYTADIVGMTTEQVMNKYKSAIAYACGSSAEELGKNLVKVIGGGSNNSDSSSDSASSIKDAMREVLSGWDGDVLCYVREDTVHINKIPDPTTAKITLAEGRDILHDSVKITDVNPGTINHLTVTVNGKEYTFKDEKLIKRFGEVKGTVNITDDKGIGGNALANTEWVKIKRDNGHSVECKAIGGCELKAGEWVRLYLPSFDIDDFMFLSKTSQDDDDGNWLANLTFVDYPPSLGEPKDETEDSESTDEEETLDV